MLRAGSEWYLPAMDLETTTITRPDIERALEELRTEPLPARRYLVAPRHKRHMELHPDPDLIGCRACRVAWSSLIPA